MTLDGIAVVLMYLAGALAACFPVVMAIRVVNLIPAAWTTVYTSVGAIVSFFAGILHFTTTQEFDTQTGALSAVTLIFFLSFLYYAATGPTIEEEMLEHFESENKSK